MRFSLATNPILTSYQTKLLKLFFAQDFAETFFLTGGTALAAFYFGHRLSKDFDLFSIEEFDAEALYRTVNLLAQETGASLGVKVKSQTYNEIYLENKEEGWVQRLDFVHEQPVRFGEIQEIEGIRVDSLENIATNKILTIYNRLEPKDYIDLYLILQKTGLKFDELFTLAKKKDAGLFEFYFAQSLDNLEKIGPLPEMKVEFNKEKMLAFYRKLQKELLLRLKPAE